MILAVTPPEDRHAAAVVDLLRERDIPVDHVDVPSLSVDTAVEFEDGRWHLDIAGRRRIDLSRSRLGWWRRDPAPVLSRDIAAIAEVDGAPVESAEALTGVLVSQRIEWVTAPAADRVARWRPVVWRAAAASGIPMPATRVTRDPAAAVRFLDAHADVGVVLKPLVRRMDDWSGCRHILREERLAAAVEDSAAECVVQRAIRGTDVRVIAIGEELFAAELDPDAEHGVEGSAARRTEIPAELGSALRTMLDALRLGSAAIDLRRDADGAYWLVDVDTVPRWLFLEELTDLPITTAMVDLLARHAHSLIR